MGLKVYVLINNQIYKLMKKLFTLIALALSVNGAFAQTESYQPFADGALKAEFASATAGADGDIVVTLQSSTNISLTVKSSRTPDITTTPGLNYTNWDVWKDAGLSYDKGPGDLPNGEVFPTLRGTGVAYISFVGNERFKDGASQGNYHPDSNGGVDGAPNGWVYYNPESPSIPYSGLYYKFVPTLSGTLRAGFWINKGNRLFFVAAEAADNSVTNVEYTVEGYINGKNGVDEYGESTGKKKYFTVEEMKAESPTPYLVGAGNQPSWVYVTFPVEAGKSYYCFNHNAQAGFNGYEFTADAAGISELTANEAALNDKTFNLAGQQVNNGFRGIVVKNGKKYIK